MVANRSDSVCLTLFHRRSLPGCITLGEGASPVALRNGYPPVTQSESRLLVDCPGFSLVSARGWHRNGEPDDAGHETHTGHWRRRFPWLFPVREIAWPGS